jgi:hypothetical protein
MKRLHYYYSQKTAVNIFKRKLARTKKNSLKS